MPVVVDVYDPFPGQYETSGAGHLGHKPKSQKFGHALAYCNTFNLDHIIRGRLELYQQDSTLTNTLLKTVEKSWGTGDSTAADRMWIAEVYAFTITTGVAVNFYIPDSAVIMPSLVGKEPDLEYLMVVTMEQMSEQAICTVPFVSNVV